MKRCQTHISKVDGIHIGEWDDVQRWRKSYDIWIGNETRFAGRAWCSIAYDKNNIFQILSGRSSDFFCELHGKEAILKDIENGVILVYDVMEKRIRLKYLLLCFTLKILWNEVIKCKAGMSRYGVGESIFIENSNFLIWKSR